MSLFLAICQSHGSCCPCFRKHRTQHRSLRNTQKIKTGLKPWLPQQMEQNTIGNPHNTHTCTYILVAEETHLIICCYLFYLGSSTLSAYWHHKFYDFWINEIIVCRSRPLSYVFIICLIILRNCWVDAQWRCWESNRSRWFQPLMPNSHHLKHGNKISSMN